ncbi:hypothetical protein ACW4TU_32095 [Streptomyces sp. QTS52]
MNGPPGPGCTWVECTGSVSTAGGRLVVALDRQLAAQVVESAERGLSTPAVEGIVRSCSIRRMTWPA